MNLLYSYILVATGLQINMPVSMAAPSPTPARWQATACPSHDNSNIASTSVHHRCSASLLTNGRGMAFATPRRSYLHNGKVCGSTDKRFPKVSQLYPCRHSSSTKLYMLPEHIEHLSLIGQFTFFLQPLLDYLYDFITFLLGLSFMFVAASVFVPNNNPNNPIATMKSEDRKTTKSLAAISGENDIADATTTGGDDTETLDDEVLTPGTYANSRMAKRQVKDTITNAASQAFDATDFTHEPHLSPEAEDVETACEVALLANAAHELADAAERENRQSKAAMLERDRELEWIEKHEDENGSAPSAMKAETFQQSLLAAQFANNLPAIQKQEAFQRSLLSARIANDAKAKQGDATVEQQQQKEEWMGSEARAASMGGEEVVPFSFASAAASSAAAHVLEEIEHENDDVSAKDGGAGDDDTTAERMILTEDIALVDHSPESSLQIVTDATTEKETQLDDEQANQDIDDSAPVQSSGGFYPDDVSSVHQWRKDYMNEIQSYVQQKSAEQRGEDFTYGKSSDMSNVDSEDSINVEKNESSQNGVLTRKPTVAEGIMKRTQKLGIMKQLRQRRKFLIVAVAVVLCRRLFLAYFGKAMRLI